MGRGRATIEQPFRVKIDLTKLCEEIVDGLVKDIEKAGAYGADIDFEVDGEEIIVSGSYKVSGDTWYCAATLESPEENEFEPDAMIDESFICDSAIDAFNMTNIEANCTFDEYEYEEPDEPDPDMMPGGWDYEEVE